MNRAATLAILTISLATGISTAIRAQESPKKVNAKPMAALGWLVGGVWTADATRPETGPGRIETRYQWADNGAYIHFNTHFINGKNTLRNYDGSFFWNPEKSGYEMWYMDHDNAITSGPVMLDGDVMEMTFRAEGFDGKPTDFRCRVTRKTPDHYTWLLEAKQPDGWKQALTLEYLRQPES